MGLQSSFNPVSASKNTSVIILAAGVGKRMQSTLPKVLHDICGQSLLSSVLRQIQKVLPDSPIAIVVNPQNNAAIQENIFQEKEFYALKITYVVQFVPRGTGDAVRCVLESDWSGKLCASVLVLPGDLPLVSQNLLEQMVLPLDKGDALRLLTCELTDPTGYGRVIRSEGSKFILGIVEDRDASFRERSIREVACSIYFIDVPFLVFHIFKITSENKQKEYYLTDIVSLAVQSHYKIQSLSWLCEDDLTGVNNLWELAKARQIMNIRCIREWSLYGVNFIDPQSTYVDLKVQLCKEVIVYPGVILRGNTFIGKGVILGPHVFLKDVEVESHAEIKAGTIAELSKIGSYSKVGPYAHLRPGTHIGSSCRVGNFVELKQVKIGDSSSIAHLSYVGDAEIGSGVNIGCGFVTCNYDGRAGKEGSLKNKTIIEDGVFLGSDCQVVAPIRIGKKSYIASGSTITKDVEPGALAIARSLQVNKLGYAARLRGSTLQSEEVDECVE